MSRLFHCTTASTISLYKTGQIFVISMTIRQAHRKIATTFVCCFVIQFALVSNTFPLSELFSDTPLFYIDNAYHWYTLKMSSFLSSGNSSILYDPYFNAGAAFAFATDPSANIPKLLIILFNGNLSEVIIWKLFVFSAAIIGPVLPGIGLAVLGFRSKQILFGLCLSTIFWWTSWFHWFHTAGMTSYVLSCYYAFFNICLFLHCWKNISITNAILIGLSGALAVFIHPLSFIPIVFFVISFLIINYRALADFRYIYFLIIFSFLSLLFNFTWLSQQFSPVFDAGIHYVSYQSRVQPENIIFEMLGIWKDPSHGSKIYTLLIMLTGISLFIIKPSERKLCILPFIVAWGLLQLYASLAGAVPILARLTQPNRYAPAGYLLLIIPAVYGMYKINVFTKIQYGCIPIFINKLILLSVILIGGINVWEVARCPSSKQMGLLSVFHKGGSGSSLFDVKPLGFDGSSGGFGWSVF